MNMVACEICVLNERREELGLRVCEQKRKLQNGDYLVIDKW